MDNKYIKPKKWWGKKENYWILGGFLIAITALSMPFFIMQSSNQKFNLQAFQTLGVVGDFFGGTTVGLLSLASIIFVTAAIIMQKEELELQREEVRATRKEYEITNFTMKKQQFESTFFNMINLQQNILKEVQIEDKHGRDAIRILFKNLEKYYEETLYNNKLALVFKELSQVEDAELRAFCKELYLAEAKKIFFDNDNKRNTRLVIAKGEDPAEAKQKFLKKQNEALEQTLKRAEEYFDNHLSESRSLQENYIRTKKDILDFIFLSNCPEIFLNFYKDYKENPIFSYKKETYETIFNELENEFGHYYRNLYRIMKIIQETGFDVSSVEENEIEKKKYRGILRAQLSSFELLMLFYNVVYSEKGKKFKKLIEGTSFFDNHINEKDFIWRSDKVELKKLQ